MSTNQTRVTTQVDSTYALPISYAGLTMLTGIDDSEQLLLFRENIDTILGLTLDIDEYKRLGQIPGSYLTLDRQNKTITAITIPPGTTGLRTNLTTVTIPAMVAAPAEPLVVQRRLVYADPYVTWTTGARVTAEQLNNNTEQLLGLIQELRESFNEFVSRGDPDIFNNPATTNLSMGGFKITNLGFPTAVGDAANKAYVDGLMATNVTNKLGTIKGIAQLDDDAILKAAQRPASVGLLGGLFFQRATRPIRTLIADGLFAPGTMWFNTSNGRVYLYVRDDYYSNVGTEYPLNTNGDIGYWVDTSSPII